MFMDWYRICQNRMMERYLMFGLEAFISPRPASRHNAGSRLDGWFEFCRFFAFAEETPFYFEANGRQPTVHSSRCLHSGILSPFVVAQWYFDGLFQVVSLRQKLKWRDHCWIVSLMQTVGHDLACDSFFFLQVNNWKASVVDREPFCLVTSIPNAISRSCTLTPCGWAGKKI